MLSTLAPPASPIRRIGQPPASSESTEIELSIAQIPGCWYVVETCPRYERRVENDLAARGLKSYLPLVRRRQWHAETKASHGQYRTTEVPAFSRYLFAAANDAEGDYSDFYAIRAVSNCLKVIPIANQAKFKRELQAIEESIRLNPAMQPLLNLSPGSYCNILSGPLMGHTGVVIRMGDRDKVFMEIKTLGQAVPLEIDISQIELI